jgi:hypothetical protein
MSLQIREVPKLSHSQVGITAAYKASMVLQEKGWMRYPACGWDKPAILAFADADCVGALNYEFDDDDLTATVRFAFCAPGHPQALSALLSRFRQIVRDSTVEEICFTCHAGNDAMARAVRIFRLSPVSMSYRMPVTRPKPKSPSVWQRFAALFA